MADLAKDHTNGGYDKFDMMQDDRKQSIDLNASLKKAVSALSRPKVAKRERETSQVEGDAHNDKKIKKSEKDLLRSFAKDFKKGKRQKV